jgi:hypothetical protein
VLDEHVPDVTGVADHDVEDPSGQPGFLQDLREQQAARDRSVRRGLQNDGVAEGEGGRQGATVTPADGARVSFKLAAVCRTVG